MEKKLSNAICDKCGSDEMYLESHKTDLIGKREKIKIYCKNCGQIHSIGFR